MLKNHQQQFITSDNQVFDPHVKPVNNSMATTVPVLAQQNGNGSDNTNNNTIISPQHQTNLGQQQQTQDIMTMSQSQQQPTTTAATDPSLNTVPAMHTSNESINLQQPQQHQTQQQQSMPPPSIQSTSAQPSPTNAMDQGLSLMDSVLMAQNNAAANNGSNHSTPLPSPLYQQQFHQHPQGPQSQSQTSVNHQQLIQEMINSSPSVEQTSSLSTSVPPPSISQQSQPFSSVSQQPMEAHNHSQQQQQQQEHDNASAAVAAVQDALAAAFHPGIAPDQFDTSNAHNNNNSNSNEQQHQQQFVISPTQPQLQQQQQVLSMQSNTTTTVVTQTPTHDNNMLILNQPQRQKHPITDGMEDQQGSRKKTRRHTMSSSFPTHLSIPTTATGFKGVNFDMPHTAAVLLDEQRMSFDHHFSNNSNASTPVGTESPMTPSVFSSPAVTTADNNNNSNNGEHQKPIIVKRIIKEQHRQALGPLTLPPPPTPAELGLKIHSAPSGRRGRNAKKAKSSTATASSSSTVVSSKKYESMSREELIAKLVELEQEKRSGSLQNTPHIKEEEPLIPAQSSSSVTVSSAKGSAAKSLKNHANEQSIVKSKKEDKKLACQFANQNAASDSKDINQDDNQQQQADTSSSNPGDNPEPPQIQHRCLWKDCGETFEGLQPLITHIGDNHVGSGKPTYSCEWEGCSRNQKPFTKRHKMYNHLRTHTGERPFVCTIPGCGKRFSRPDSLTTHIKTHSNVRPYICQADGCGKAYYHARSLKKHEKIHEFAPATPTPSSTITNVSSNQQASLSATAYPGFSIAGTMPPPTTMDYQQAQPPHPSHSTTTTSHPNSPQHHVQQHSATTLVSNQFHVMMPTTSSSTMSYTPQSTTIEQQPQGGQFHSNNSSDNNQQQHQGF